MDKRLKWAIYGVGGTLLALILSWCVLRFGFQTDIFARKGWNGEQYLNGLGRPLTGWQTIEGKRYYFALSDGRRVTGWLETEQGRFLLDEKGSAKTGWYTDETGTYLFGSDGRACTGWIDTEQGARYFEENGTLAVGLLEFSNGTWYFQADGTPGTGWFTFDENTYYFDKNGQALTGWQELDQRCYFHDNGTAANGWQEMAEGRYYFEQGRMHTGWLNLDADRYFMLDDGTMAVGEQLIDGVSRFFTSKGKYVVLVNRNHAVPEDYTMELVDIEGFQFDISGRDALANMLAACREAGHPCYINNTYRSEYTQERLYNRRLREYIERGMSYYEADYIINQSLMTPGHSEHHLGLAVDLHCSDAAYKWLEEHCWEYGFILRYPEGKFDETGVIYEPWHFRYVGTELSLEMQGTGLCLEEYMKQISLSFTEGQ